MALPSHDRVIETFPKYARRQALARFLARYEIFKLQIGIKGSVVECGVHEGSGLMTWAKISSILEPYAYQRRVIGFDTFAGFPHIDEKDTARTTGIVLFNCREKQFPNMSKLIVT